MPREWTKEQRAAIETTGTGLLVSAAAGSGKTSVLAERCAYLVCDAQPPCDVTQLLVVTFTEAAAAEMKSRIDSALRARLAQSDDPRLRRQLKLIEHAPISTLHGFCFRLLRHHFHRLGLDPNVSVLDEDEATLLRSDTVRQLFEDRYESGDDAFQRLVTAYGNGADDRLMDTVVSLHALMTSVVDPDAWMTEARRRIDDATTNELTKSDFGRAYCSLIAEKLRALQDACADAKQSIPQTVFPKYHTYLADLAATAKQWSSIFESKGYDALAAAYSNFDAPRLPSVSADTPGKDQAAATMSSVKELFTKGTLGQSLRFTSDQWRAGMKSIAPHVDTLLTLISDFDARYTRAKSLARGLDFADLERLALKLLRDESRKGLHPSPTARTYHRQFAHVLVDEYQDINEVQDAILHLISTECCSTKSDDAISSNLFCVGDVKQAIYRFRLADPHRFLEKESRYRVGATHASPSPSGAVIDLKSNFRSRAPLLSAINQTFQRLMTLAAADIDYTDVHRLNPGLKYPDGLPSTFPGSPIELHLLPAAPRTPSHDDSDDDDFDRTDLEAILIARRIRSLLGLDDASPPMQVMHRVNNELVPRPLAFSDIVILLRSPKFKSTQIADILRAHQIPVHTEKGTGFFEAQEVRDILALLSLLDNQQQDVPLAAVLRSPLAALPNPEDALARIRLAAPRPHASLHTHHAPLPFHQAVIHYAGDHDDELSAHLKSFLSQLSRYRDLAHKRPLAELLWLIYEETGYLAFVSGLDDGAQKYANLLHLHERAKQFGSFSRQGLYRFLRFLESLQEEKETARPAVASEAENVVRIMSIHASKGLEFPLVFLADLGKKHNLTDCRSSILVDRQQYVGLQVVDEQKQIRYPSLAHVLVQQRLTQQALAEEMRLLYVAMTRAKEHLILVGTCKEDEPEKWRAKWSNHQGAMPAAAVLASSRMIDWIGPVAAMTSRENAFDVHTYSQDDLATWTADDLRRPKLTPQQQRLARLEPLSPAPEQNAVAQQIIDRLSYTYPHKPFTDLPAAQSVTTWSKHGRPTPLVSADQPAQLEFTSELPTPRFLAEEIKPTAAELGSLTHTVLQYLDFSLPPDELSIASQINTLISKKILTSKQARGIDVDAILWLLQSDLGALLRANHKTLRRELPLYMPLASIASPDPLDHTMLRGRLDALIPTAAGHILIDYKTDRVTPDQVPQRAAFYEPQLKLYRDFLENLTAGKVAAVYLVFLSPRVIHTVAGSDDSRDRP